MNEFTKYNVILSGKVMPNEDRASVINDLCELFHSTPSYMEKLLSGEEVALKKEYTVTEAERVCKAVRAAGAECKMVAVQAQPLEVVEDEVPSELSVTEFVVSCPSCSRDCDSKEDNCPHCGFILTREGDSQFSFSVTDHGYEGEGLREIDATPLEMAHMSSMKRFIGPNADYYARKFPLFNSVRHPKFRLSWHWPALFVFFYWALYRKLWVAAGINLAGIVLLFVFPALSAIGLIYVLIWPAIANYIYFLHVSKHVRESPEHLSQPEKDERLAGIGGTSKAAVVGGILVIFILSLAARTLLLNAYEDKYGYGANPNQQIRGDGTVLNIESISDAKIARTSSALIVLSNALKVVIAGGNQTVVEKTIENLVFRSENEEIRDAWDVPILIQRSERTVELLSAGPDRRHRTLDDIKQIIPFK